MAEARFTRDPELHNVLLDGTVGAYEVRQLPSGECGFLDLDDGGTSGQYKEFRKRGQATVAKATSVVLLKGCRVYWDHSANQATFRKVNDRDFYMGRAAETATSAQTTTTVDLNVDPPYDIDALNHAALSVVTGTQGIRTMGIWPNGGSRTFILSSTSEVQKVDLLSVAGFATGANAIIEAIFCVPNDGAGTNTDVSIGVANGTHATDADSITESIFCHLDGNNTNINFESDDGTTEVAATDSTTDYTEGSAVANLVYVWIDMGDPTSVKVYVNGVQVLSGTTFNVNAAAGPWFLLCHVEKSSSADVYELRLDALRAWFAEQ
jgi:hypothetical protein